VRLSPLVRRPLIVLAPDDRLRVCSSRLHENWQEKRKYSENICPSSTLSTTNPIWPDLGSNAGRRSGKPATNRLSYGTAAYEKVRQKRRKKCRRLENLGKKMKSRVDIFHLSLLTVWQRSVDHCTRAGQYRSREWPHQTRKWHETSGPQHMEVDSQVSLPTEVYCLSICRFLFYTLHETTHQWLSWWWW
jgi:hypothetical protein